MSDEPSLHSTLGALELAIVIGSALFGCTLLQTFLYHTSKDAQTDRAWVKIMVYLVVSLDVIHTGLLWQYLYYMTVNHFGDKDFVAEAYWSFASAVPIGMCISVLTQSFFAYRGYILARALPVAITIWFLSFVRFAFSIVVGVVFHNHHSLVEIMDNFGWLMNVILAITTATVLLNTGYLTYTLWRLKGDFKQTRVTLNTLIIWTSETGMLTSAIYIVALVTVVMMPHNNIWISFVQVTVKLYSNSLLATLNCRSALRARAAGPAVHITMDKSNPVSDFEMTRPGAQIRVEVETTVQTDKANRTKSQVGHSDPDKKYSNRPSMSEFQLGFQPLEEDRKEPTTPHSVAHLYPF